MRECHSLFRCQFLSFPTCLPLQEATERERERVCVCVCIHVYCVSVCISVCLSVCAPHSHKGYAAAVHQLPWDGCFMTRGWRLSSFGSNGRKCQSFSPSTARSAFVLFGCVLLFYSALKGPGTSLVCRPLEARSDARLIVSSTHARTHARTHAHTQAPLCPPCCSCARNQPLLMASSRQWRTSKRFSGSPQMFHETRCAHWSR